MLWIGHQRCADAHYQLGVNLYVSVNKDGVVLLFLSLQYINVFLIVVKWHLELLGLHVTIRHLDFCRNLSMGNPMLAQVAPLHICRINWTMVLWGKGW